MDAIRLGRQHIRNGRIEFSQSKGRKGLSIAVAPQLLQASVAMPPIDKGHLCFLVNGLGRPFSNPGFGNWFREQCDAAGLPLCTAHGLRKAMMRRMAELHMGNQTPKSVSSHSGDDEVATYTRNVDQQRLADDAISLLSHWENGAPRDAKREHDVRY